MKWNLKVIFFGQTWATLGQIFFHSRGPVLTRGSLFSVTFTDMNTCWPGSGSEMLPTKVTMPYRETNSQSDCVPTTTSPIHFDPTSSSFTFFPAATEFVNTHTHTQIHRHSHPYRNPLTTPQTKTHIHTHTPPYLSPLTIPQTKTYTHTHTLTYTSTNTNTPLSQSFANSPEQNVPFPLEFSSVVNLNSAESLNLDKFHSC